MSRVLSVRELRVDFPAGPAVDGVSFELFAGECLAIVGESGAGKSLTARAVLGLAPRAAWVGADELVVAGVDVQRYRTEAQWNTVRGRLVGYVSQDALVALDPLRRIGREVAEAVEVHEPRLARADLADRVLGSLRAAAMPEAESRARQYPHELSGGLRQRALIASAISARPHVIIADEPTTALDATVQAQIIALLADLKRRGLGVLLISHDLHLVSRIADRVAVMREGVIVEQGEVSRVLTSPQHDYTRELLAALPSRRARASEGGDMVLEARGVRRRYRTRVALDDVSVGLRANTTLGIVGESGSGKSTLARILMALERPDAGEVLLDGAPWSGLSERERRPLRHRIQLIDQDPFGTLNPRWSVRRALGEAVALAGDTDRRARVQELLELVALPESLLRRKPHELSGGQRQRVAIARALARRPEILVCDEPVSALDATVQARVLDLLADLRERLGLSMVFISHDLAVIAHVADDLAVMRDGRVVEYGPASEVLAHPQHDFTRALISGSLA